MKSTLLSLVVAAGLVYLGACLYLYFMQRSLMYFPTPPASNVSAERLFVDSGGVRLALWRLHGGRRDAVLYFGGNAEDVALNIPEFDAWFAGCAVYLVNYRGYGGSEGKPREEDLYRDAVAAFDRLRAEHERVAVIGRSLGSGVATYLATVRPVDRLALVTPAASFARLAGELYPLFPTGLMLKDRYDSLARAGRLRTPVMILIAENDEIVPPAHAHDLAAAIDPSLVTTRVIANAGHNTIGTSPEYGAALRPFVCNPAFGAPDLLRAERVHHWRRRIPGMPSNPASKLNMRSIPCCSITATCSASRAESRRFPRTISLARSAAAWSTART